MCMHAVHPLFGQTACARAMPQSAIYQSQNELAREHTFRSGKRNFWCQLAPIVDMQFRHVNPGLKHRANSPANLIHTQLEGTFLF